MTKLLLALSLALTLSAHAATQPSSNIPIGKMPIATNLKTSAFIPIIQPYDGRTTNDNFRISSTNWLGFSTNSPVQNFYVTNIFATNIITSNLFVTNLYVTNLFVSNIVNGGELWMTNASGLYLPSITNTATIVVGQSAEAWWVPNTGDGFVSVHDSSVGDSDFNSLAIAAIDNVIQENYSAFSVGLQSGTTPNANMNLASNTNYQDPAAPISKFSVQLQPAYGEVLLQLINNGVTELEVSNQVTSVQGLQLSPLTNAVIGLGNNNINVASNSYVRIQASFADPTITAIELSAGVRDGMLLLLQNIGTLSGFTLFNGSLLYDDPSHFVTLNNGNWVTTNSGDGLLLIGGASGWFEIGRFINNTNTVTGDLLWELSSNHMRTVPDTVEDWQFRYGGIPQTTIYTNGAVVSGPNTATFWGSPFTQESFISQHVPSLGDPNYNEFWIGTGDDFNNGGMIDGYCNTNSVVFLTKYANATGGTNSIGQLTVGEGVASFSLAIGTHGVTVLDPYIGGTSGDVSTNAAYTFDTSSLLTQGTIARFTHLGTNQIFIGPSEQIIFGEGRTNTLYRTGNDLVYTNGSTANSRFTVLNGSGNGISVMAQGSSSAAIQTEGVGVNTLILRQGSDQASLTGGGFSPTVDVGLSLGSPNFRWKSLDLSETNRIWGYLGAATTNYSYASLWHGGTNGTIHFGSYAGGIAGVARPFEVERNLGATLAVGDVAVVDMFTPSATNSIAGTMTFTHATNGLDLVEFTHVRTFFNGSGSDRTVNLPSGWHKGAGAGSSFVVTNATMAKLYVTCTGPTGSAALQTNVTATVSFFP